MTQGIAVYARRIGGAIHYDDLSQKLSAIAWGFVKMQCIMPRGFSTYIELH
jgi:hypothetical protein